MEAVRIADFFIRLFHAEVTLAEVTLAVVLRDMLIYLYIYISIYLY